MRIKIFTVISGMLLVCIASFGGQNASSLKAKDLPIDEVIRRFAAAETENKEARKNYAFTQDFDITTIGEAGSVTGRHHKMSDIVLDDRGNRVEKITYFPPPTLRDMSLTREDECDLANVQPFGLTTDVLPKYQIDYIGKEKVDELNTYVFDVKPKRLVKGERYLQGRIWVDDVDLQIVKIKGKAVPDDDRNKYPNFETYRENIDEKYWFPTYVYADDVLDFKNNPVHMRMVVKFTNYKKFTTGIRVADEPGEVAKPDDVKKSDADIKKNDAQSKKPEPKKPPMN